MDAPVGGKTNDAIEEITNAEIKNEEKHWISNNHRKLLAELPLDPIREAVEVDGGDGDKVAD